MAPEAGMLMQQLHPSTDYNAVQLAVGQQGLLSAGGRMQMSTSLHVGYGISLVIYHRRLSR